MSVRHLSYEEFVRQARALVTASHLLGNGWELRHVNPAHAQQEETAYLVKKLSRSVTFETEETGASHEALEPENTGEECVLEDEDTATFFSPGDNGKCLSRREGTVVHVHFEYHVIYSPSYRVPVLYFTASYASGKQLPLERVWQVLSPLSSKEDGMEWGLATQLEHPLLSCPFYHIHPCHTATAMEQAFKMLGSVSEEDGGGGGQGVDGGSDTGRYREQGQGSRVVNAGKGREGRNTGGDAEEDRRMIGGEFAGKNSSEECSRITRVPAPSYLLSWLSMFGPVAGLTIPLNYVLTTDHSTQLPADHCH